MQFNLFASDDDLKSKTTVLPAGFDYLPDFMSPQNASLVYEHLIAHLPWQQPTIEVYGKSHLVPRLQCWMADKGVQYHYSGKLFTASGWEQTVWDIKGQVERATSMGFNSALINLYRNGDDKMGWHSDDEQELGVSPAVVTVSLGAKRTFQFRHNIVAETHNLELAHGSLLLMKPGVQASYKHAVPARKKITQSRISLTFRNIVK